MENQMIVRLFDLSGKAAIVTGGAQWIGQGCALRLAEAGAAVMVVDINLAGAEETCQQIATAKGGVISMTRSLAKDLGEAGINVNCIVPGPFLHDAVKKMAPDLYQGAIAHTVLKRSGTPQDIANAVLFLSSSASDFVTGAVLHVDGGFVLY